MKKKIDLPCVKGEIEIDDYFLHSKVVKKFFSRTDIEDAIKNDNFDYVYKEWTRKILPNNQDLGNRDLTKIFLAAGIDVLDYLTEIPEFAFWKCTSLTSITIPNNIKKIGDRAFFNCELLKSITILNGVTEIDNLAFWKCKSLTSVTIPHSVTKIKGHAFEECDSLTSVTIPRSVTAMGWGVFSNCENLKTIYCEAKKEPISWDWEGGWLAHCKAKVIWGA